eukprot:1156784-Pelagomonas_calceolata.AAC.5
MASEELSNAPIERNAGKHVIHVDGTAQKHPRVVKALDLASSQKHGGSPAELREAEGRGACYRCATMLSEGIQLITLLKYSWTHRHLLLWQGIGAFTDHTGSPRHLLLRRVDAAWGSAAAVGSEECRELVAPHHRHAHSL